MHGLKMAPFVPPEQHGQARQPLNYRLLIVGAQGVGKYSLHHQFVYSVFPPIRDPFFDTEATELLWRGHNDEEHAYRINPARMNISKLGDKIGGNNHYPNTVVPLDIFRLHEANGLVLVYSIISRTSFEALERFIEARQRDEGTNAVRPKVICVIGNKLDSSRDKRKVLCIEGEKLASKLECSFAECSAKDSKGLDKARLTIIKALDKQREQLLAERGELPPERERKKLKRVSSNANARSTALAGVTRSDTQCSSSSDDRGGTSAKMTARPTLAQIPSFGTQPKSQPKSANSSLYSEERISATPSPVMSPVTRSNTEPQMKSKESKSRWQFGSKGAKTVSKPEHRLSQTSPIESDRSKPVGISITPSAQVVGLGTLIQYRPPPRKRRNDPPPSPQQARIIGELQNKLPAVFPVDRLDPLNPHPGTKVPLPGSVPPSRRGSMEIPTQISALSSERHSPEIESPATTRDSDDVLTPPTSGEGIPLGMFTTSLDDTSRLVATQKYDARPREFLPLPDVLRRSNEQSSPIEERRKLEQETRLLEEERRKLMEQRQKVAEERKRIAELRQVEEERKKIEEERRRVQEERQKIAEELRSMEEENKRLMQEDIWWKESIAKALPASPLDWRQDFPVEQRSSAKTQANRRNSIGGTPSAPNYGRSQSAMEMRPNDNAPDSPPRRLSKDDTFIEPPPRNPARSASRMGFRSPPASPVSEAASPARFSEQEKHVYRFEHGLRSDASAVEQISRPSDRGQLTTTNGFVTNNLPPVKPSQVLGSSKLTHHGPPPTDLPSDIVQAATTSHLLLQQLSGNAPYARSMGDLSIQPAFDDGASSILSDTGSVKTTYGSGERPDFTARVVRINRVSRSFDPADVVTALPPISAPQQQHRYVSANPPQTLRSNTWNGSSDQSDSYTGYSKGHNKSSIGHVSISNVSTIPPPPQGKVLSLAERFKKKDEEENRKEQQNGGGGLMWTGNERGYGYAVKPSTLPPIMEGQATEPGSRTSWADDRRGRYV